MGWPVLAGVSGLWVTCGWTLALVGLLLVCVNCWQKLNAPVTPASRHRDRRSPVTPAPVHLHSSSEQTPHCESAPGYPPFPSSQSPLSLHIKERPYLPPPVEDGGNGDHDNDEEDFEEVPAPRPAPPRARTPGSLRKQKKSGTDADSHGSYVNLQDDYVNVRNTTMGSSPGSDSEYLEVLPTHEQANPRNQNKCNHSYENVSIVDGSKPFVGFGKELDYENVMGPCSL